MKEDLGSMNKLLCCPSGSGGSKSTGGKGRFAPSVDKGPCQQTRFWKKSFVYYLKAVALLCVVTGEEENEKEERDLSLQRRCLR